MVKGTLQASTRHTIGSFNHREVNMNPTIRRTAVAIVMILGSALTVVAGAAAPAAADTPPSGVTWTQDTAKSDDFNSLDSSKWGTSLWYATSNSFAFKDTNVTVSGGNAILTAKKETYNNKSYTEGALKSKFTVGGNSYTEVRAKMSDHRANVTSAIWLSDMPTQANNPNYEIDMLETTNTAMAAYPNRVDTTLHKWPINPDSHTQITQNNGWYAPSNLDAAFHTYGLERRNGMLRFYFDGTLYWQYDASTEPSIVTQERAIIFSQEGNAGAPVDAYLPAGFQIDYVHVYTTPGTNQITNPGFESGGGQSPVGWNKWNDTTGASFAAYDPGGAHSGNYKLSFQQDQPYLVATTQTPTALPSGTYTLKAWVAVSDPSKFSEHRMYIRNYGSTELTALITNANWTQVTIPNISVTSGQAEIGFVANHGGGTGDWMVVDDVEFFKN